MILNPITNIYLYDTLKFPGIANYRITVSTI